MQSAAGKTIYFAKVCMQKGKTPQEKSVQAASRNESSDSGDSIMAVELDQSENDTIMTVHDLDRLNHGA